MAGVLVQCRWRDISGHRRRSEHRVLTQHRVPRVCLYGLEAVQEVGLAFAHFTISTFPKRGPFSSHRLLDWSDYRRNNGMDHEVERDFFRSLIGVFSDLGEKLPWYRGLRSYMHMCLYGRGTKSWWPPETMKQDPRSSSPGLTEPFEQLG